MARGIGLTGRCSFYGCQLKISTTRQSSHFDGLAPDGFRCCTKSEGAPHSAAPRQCQSTLIKKTKKMLFYKLLAEPGICLPHELMQRCMTDAVIFYPHL